MKNSKKIRKQKSTLFPERAGEYDQYITLPPIEFNAQNLSHYENSISMVESEFLRLEPRLIHSEIIGWESRKDSVSKPIRAYIYITDGITTRSDEIKVNSAHSYFVRFDNYTWKPYNLISCFEIINGIRLYAIKDLRETMQFDKREAARQAKEAKKKP